MTSVHPPDPPLGDDVLTLRVLAEGDIDALVEACNDPEIPRWTTVPQPYRRADGEAFVVKVAEDWRDSQAATFTFRRHEVGRLDGMISLSLVAKGIGVVGYWTAPWARGEGLATRALEVITAWGLGPLQLARIDLATLPGNRGSERVAQKVGFTGGDIVKFGFVHNGVRRDVRVWSRRAEPVSRS